MADKCDSCGQEHTGDSAERLKKFFARVLAVAAEERIDGVLLAGMADEGAHVTVDAGVLFGEGLSSDIRLSATMLMHRAVDDIAKQALADYGLDAATILDRQVLQ